MIKAIIIIIIIIVIIIIIIILSLVLGFIALKEILFDAMTFFFSFWAQMLQLCQC